MPEEFEKLEDKALKFAHGIVGTSDRFVNSCSDFYREHGYLTENQVRALFKVWKRERHYGVGRYEGD